MTTKSKNNSPNCPSASQTLKEKRPVIISIALAFVLSVATVVGASVGALPTFGKYSDSSITQDSANVAFFSVTPQDFTIELKNTIDGTTSAGSSIADISTTTNVLISFDATAKSEVEATETIKVVAIPVGIDVTLDDFANNGEGKSSEKYTNDAGQYVYDCTFSGAANVLAGTSEQTNNYTLVFTLSDTNATLDSTEPTTQIYVTLEQID
jgi:hypothetical protein